jgi:hypothetical protein
MVYLSSPGVLGISHCPVPILGIILPDKKKSGTQIGDTVRGPADRNIFHLPVREETIGVVAKYARYSLNFASPIGTM